MEGLTVNITVTAMLGNINLGLAAEVTERTLLRFAVDAIEYAVIGLAMETRVCSALKLANDVIQ